MQILHKPILTEKVSVLTEKLNRYAFQVDVKANKIQIKSAVESMFNAKVDSINTMIYAGKAKGRNTKTGYVMGKEAKYKKAIITLKQGEIIDFYN